MQFIGYLYYLIPLLQIITAVHVIKTGRSWYWLWIIFFFPLIGAAVYFFAEIIPGFQRSGFQGMAESTLNALRPGREQKLLQEALEDSDTVQNRRALAEYHLSHGEAPKAVELYRSSLTGVFKDDPHVNLGLGCALVEAGEPAEAKKVLEALRKRNAAYETSKRDLFYARALEALGDEKEAIKSYEELLQKYGSEVEGACRLARLFEKTGQTDKALPLYQELVKKSKRFSAHYRKEQIAWIKMAKERLKELKSS